MKFPRLSTNKELFWILRGLPQNIVQLQPILILNRWSMDFDALLVSALEAAKEEIEKSKKVNIDLSKVVWKKPVLWVNIRKKLKLLKVLVSREPLKYAFRS